MLHHWFTQKISPSPCGNCTRAVTREVAVLELRGELVVEVGAVDSDFVRPPGGGSGEEDAGLARGGGGGGAGTHAAE